MAFDPGVEGAVARLDTDAPRRSRLQLYPMPVAEDFKWDPWLTAEAIFKWGLAGAERFIVEQCHAFPGPQAYSSAKVMEGYGILLGAIASRFQKEHVQIVPAGVWKKAMGISVSITKAGRFATAEEKKVAYKARKLAAVEAAEKEFERSFRTERGRLLDGQAEAALLALYGQGLWI